MPMRKQSGGLRFIYYSHQTLQVPRVARQCMVALCEGIAEQGADVEIVSFTARMHPSEPEHPPFDQLYGVRTPVRHTAIRIPGAVVDNDTTWFKLSRLAVYLWHIIAFILRGGLRRNELVIVSARNYSVLFALAIISRITGGSMVVLADVHGMPSSPKAGIVHRMVGGNICISRALATDLTKAFGLDPDRVTVAHSGVRPERFAPAENTTIAEAAERRRQIRSQLGLPVDRRIVCYTGKVYYRYEEIVYLVEAARCLDGDALIVVVGGRPDHVARWQQECRSLADEKIIFRSFVPPSEIPLWMDAADALVLYYSPSPLNDYRSPGKLFEYLASGRPVIACSTRSVSEVISNGYNGFLVEPYRPDMLADVIRGVLARSPEELKRIGNNAIATAGKFRWSDRGERFIAFGRRLAPANTRTRIVEVY